MQIFSFNAKILTPIHIRNGQERDGLDFVLKNDRLHIIEQSWIEGYIAQHSDTINTFLDTIKSGKFKELSQIKAGLKEHQYKILKSYLVGACAQKSLSQEGGSSNKSIIKQFVHNHLNNIVYIPGSTIKGILTTIMLMGYIKEHSITITDAQSQTKEVIEGLSRKLICSDIMISDAQEKIQIVKGVNKPKKDFRTKKLVTPKGIPIVTHTVTEGNFAFCFDIDNSNFMDYLSVYSKILIDREERIINNIGSGLNTNLIANLRNYREDRKYPIKIGMFKKSLTYKLYWEELLSQVYSKPNHKTGNMDMDTDKALKIGVGDKSLYCDESNNPVGRIILSLK